MNLTRFSILILLKLLFGSKIYHPTVKQSEAFAFRRMMQLIPAQMTQLIPVTMAMPPAPTMMLIPVAMVVKMPPSPASTAIPSSESGSEGGDGMGWLGWCVAAFSWRGNVMIRK